MRRNSNPLTTVVMTVILTVLTPIVWTMYMQDHLYSKDRPVWLPTFIAFAVAAGTCLLILWARGFRDRLMLWWDGGFALIVIAGLSWSTYVLFDPGRHHHITHMWLFVTLEIFCALWIVAYTAYIGFFMPSDGFEILSSV